MKPAAKEKLDFYRSEARGEHDLVTSRLNGFLAGQSFLVLAYSMSMTADPAHAAQFQLFFPPVLAVAAALIATRAIAGINAAKLTMDLWREKTRLLLKTEDTVGDFSIIRAGHTDNTGKHTDDVHESSLRFATLTPVLFLLLWIALAIIWYFTRSGLPHPYA